MNYANAIDKVLKYSGLPAVALSELSGIPMSEFYSVKSGEDPKPEMIEAIANHFNVPKSVIVILGLEPQDVAQGKREIFKLLKPALDGLVGAILTAKDKDDPRNHKDLDDAFKQFMPQDDKPKVLDYRANQIEVPGAGCITVTRIQTENDIAFKLWPSGTKVRKGDEGGPFTEELKKLHLTTQQEEFLQNELLEMGYLEKK